MHFKSLVLLKWYTMGCNDYPHHWQLSIMFSIKACCPSNIVLQDCKKKKKFKLMKIARTSKEHYIAHYNLIFSLSFTTWPLNPLWTWCVLQSINKKLDENYTIWWVGINCSNYDSSKKLVDTKMPMKFEQSFISLRN
jgi:hypothetical protein